MASDELLGWCRTNGVVCHGIQAGFVEQGWRGVLATQDLDADTCVLRVPLRLLLTARSARQDPLLHSVLSSAEGCSLCSDQVLAVHLLSEVSKGEDSFWRPYLLSLPREYSTAMCFGAEDSQALQVPYAQQAVQQAAEVALRQWREALPAMRALGLPPKYLTRQAWLWAASTLSSRTMYLPFDPAGALNPFGDLHNYAPPPPPFTPALLTPADPQPPPHKAEGRGMAGQARVWVQQAQQEACAPQGPHAVREPQQAQHAAQQAAQALEHMGIRREETPREAGGGAGLPRVSCPLPSFQRQLPPTLPPAAGVLSKGRGGGDFTAGGAGIGGEGRRRGLEGGAHRDALLGPSRQQGQHETQQAQRGTAGSALEGQRAGQRCAAGEAQQGQQGEGGRFLEGKQDRGADPGLCGDGAFDEAAGEYRIYTRRRYRAGEQVFLCYGRHTNLELLQHYGFVMGDNPHDTANLPRHLLPPEVTQQLPPSSDTCGGSDGDGGGCYVHHNGAPSWELLRALRLASASSAERRSRAYLALQDLPISRDGEVRALGVLRDACRATLSTLPTNAVQDQRMLIQQAPGLAGCARLAVEWRLEYKLILERCIGMCTQAISRPDLIPAEDA